MIWIRALKYHLKILNSELGHSLLPFICNDSFASLWDKLMDLKLSTLVLPIDTTVSLPTNEVDTLIKDCITGLGYNSTYLHAQQLCSPSAHALSFHQKNTTIFL